MHTNEPKVAEQLGRLVETIKESDTYQRFVEMQRRLDEEPELRDQVDEFRMKNFELQQNYQGDELLQKLEEFTDSYSEFRENPLVDQYLSAELTFCRMIQDLGDELTNQLRF